MSIKDKYCVKPAYKYEIKDWIMKKHYAHRMPSISCAFGLYEESMLRGVCTFGPSANYIELKKWEPFDFLELNRLVVNDDHEKNVVSFFISSCLKQLSKPKVIISYADFRQGHHGYIYQATNWLYTGTGGEGEKIYITRDGREMHQRSVDIGDGGKKREKLFKIGYLVDTLMTGKKARYYYFIGNKSDIRRMKSMLRFDVQPYPKGNNKRYDASYKPDANMRLL